MRYLLLRMKRFCGFIVGFVFFVSGILKIMDPVGAGLVMKEYMEFLHLGFLSFAAKLTGTAFAMAEVVIGIGLVTGVWRRIVAPVAIAIQGFFTLLTLLLVIFNPEMDCGCFGEAIHLTHMETFIKNIILLILLLIYYIPKKHLGETKARKYVAFGIVTISALAFCIYSWIHIPLIDYTAFKPGTHLGSSDSEANYESVFVYEKDGIQQTVTLENLPDSTWTFVSTETVRMDRDDENTVNLSFYDTDGVYADSLAMKGKVMIISIYESRLRHAQKERAERFMSDARKAGFKALLLTSSEQVASEFEESYICDYKTLITLNRSNGGATYFSDGYLVRKWGAHSYPDASDLEALSHEDMTETIIRHDTNSSLTFQAFLLYVFAVMLLL